MSLASHRLSTRSINRTHPASNRPLLAEILTLPLVCIGLVWRPGLVWVAVPCQISPKAQRAGRDWFQPVNPQ